MATSISSDDALQPLIADPDIISEIAEILYKVIKEASDKVVQG